MLDDGVVHANHGSFGGITRATHEAVTAARARVAADPMRFFTREYHRAHERAVEAAAGLVGADPAATSLVPNATAGMVAALDVLAWGMDATVVVTDQGYLSVLAAVRQRAAATGTRVVVVATDPWHPDDVPEAVAARLDEVAGHGPVGLVVDQVASAAACAYPIDRLVAAARDRDVRVVVDAAHVPGQYPPDRAWVPADAWTGNLHKWACAPHSVGVLVVDPAHHASFSPVVPTWYADLDYPGNAAWQGTLDPGPMLVTPQVVDQAEAILGHAAAIESRAAEGAATIAAAVGGGVLPGAGWMRTVQLPEAVRAAPVVAAAMAGTTADPLGSPLDLAARAIEARGIEHGLEVKVTPLAGELYLRLSCHAYTSAGDHDRIARVLGDLVAAG